MQKQSLRCISEEKMPGKRKRENKKNPSTVYNLIWQQGPQDHNWDLTNPHKDFMALECVCVRKQ